MNDSQEMAVDDEQPQDSVRGRKADPELLAISAIIRTLDRLPEPARGRCVAYITDRYVEDRS